MPITVTTLLTAVNCPPVQRNTLNPSLIAAYNDIGSGLAGAPTIGTGENSELPAILNQAFAYEWIVANRGGGMPGILFGLAFSFVSGLTMQLSAGQANIGGLVELAQTNIAVPDSATNFLWLNSNGALQFVVGTAPPNATSICLGNVTAAAGTITAFDNSGVQYNVGGLCQRSTADLWSPTDTPNAAARILTKALNGAWLWDGLSHKQLIDNASQQPDSAAALSISGTVQLANSVPNILWITVTAGTPNLRLPNPANCPRGFRVKICNLSGGNFVLQDYTGVTNYCTVTPGNQVTTGILPATGAFAFPVGPYTPVAIGFGPG
jgi:hypothetical protein